MRTRRMGRDGPEVPVVCFGTWPLGGAYGSVEEGTAIATMHAAMDAGLTFIDTAEGYMNAETIIDWAPGPKQLVTYPGAGHGLRECADELRTLLEDWLTHLLLA